jgi:hypothetical protein
VPERTGIPKLGVDRLRHQPAGHGALDRKLSKSTAFRFSQPVRREEHAPPRTLSLNIRRLRTIRQVPDDLNGVTAEHVVVIAPELETAGVIHDDLLRCDSVEELFGGDLLLVIRKPILILKFKKTSPTSVFI